MFGFKASLNFFGKRTKKGHSQLSPDMNVSGAYRTSRDDSFGYNNSFEQAKRSTASEQLLREIRPTKSATDLSTARNIPPHLRHSAVEVSRDPRGAPQEDHHRNGAQPKLTKTQEREQRMLEKKRLAEQKANDKRTAQEQAKQEKLRAERAQKETQPMRPKRTKESAKAKESTATIEKEIVRRPDRKKQPAPKPQPTGPIAATSQQYSTNTLESSISRSSGPPPYSDVPINKQETITGTQNQNDSIGNVTYSKPVDTGSWDMISQHRQQTIRPNTVIGTGSNKNKQLVMDLNYNFETTTEVKENSNSDA